LREKTTLVEIIAAAGGMTAYAQKNMVKVIRRKQGQAKPEVLIFDLSIIESLEHPELVLRDKDIIYVVPKDIRVVGETILPYTAFLSLVSSLGTITVLILNISRR
jgi:protein involved in polysaccharide export with SLBB domain